MFKKIQIRLNFRTHGKIGTRRSNQSAGPMSVCGLLVFVPGRIRMGREVLFSGGVIRGS